VRRGVGVGARQPELLVGVEDDPDRAPRRARQLGDAARRLDDDAAAGGVVLGAGAEVPGVEVTGEEDDLLRPLPPDDLADHVGGRLGR
jgi:hypothetical protein